MFENIYNEIYNDITEEQHIDKIESICIDELIYENNIISFSEINIDNNTNIQKDIITLYNNIKNKLYKYFL